MKDIEKIKKEARIEFARSGGNASVNKKSPEQMEKHIKMMVKARLKKLKAKKSFKNKDK